MKEAVSYLSFEETGFFSKIAVDYVNQNAQLRPFYRYETSIEGIKASIEARKQFPQNRNVLVEELTAQYANIENKTVVMQNIAKLASTNAFTITTAHQPNIYTGPLYFIYKIAHVIKLSQYLKEELPTYDFVPVYYMGSEDADLEEIGQFTVDGKKYVWETKQTGAVGKMIVDKQLLKLLSELKGQINITDHGKELTELFELCYTEGKTIQQATLEIVHALFGAYGLVVLIPDNANLKRLFEPVVVKELTELFSHPIVEKTSEALSASGYQQQASGRELNLFYLTDNARERIECDNEHYKVPALNLAFTQEEILAEVHNYPERFSGNVILRGAFQETVLPNILFVGGGGELAYWLELKDVFANINVPYPMLILRNSFILLNELQAQKLASLSISTQQIFLPENYILDYLVNTKGGVDNDFTKQRRMLETAYQQMAEKAQMSDPNLGTHLEVLLAKSWEKIERVADKMRKAERQKLQTEIQRIKYLKSTLFPHNSLQERVENLASLYASEGQQFIENILQISAALNSRFIFCGK